MRLIAALACTILMVLVGAGTGHAEKRVALVVGNGAYQHADKLANPVTDARRLKEKLAKLGFDVVYGEDLDKRSLERAIAQFAHAAQDAKVALVYFAGHGATFGDTPYVVPVDARFQSLVDVPYELVPVETLIGELRRAKGVRIAILDACRDNAAERDLKRVAARGGEVSRGLARVKNPEGLILAYATQYMATAADGPANGDSTFTAALLDQIDTPGLDVKDLFFRVGGAVIAKTDGAQRPEISVSFYDSFALVPAGPAAQAPAAAAPADLAERTWAAIASTTSQPILEDFIRQFGATPYGLMARARLEQLKQTQVAVVAPPVAPAVPSGPCGGGAVTASLSARAPCPLTAAEERALAPKDVFKECDKCPEMVVVPAGSFMMGSPKSDKNHYDDEEPQHSVTLARQFAVGRFSVTFDEWDACVADGGCNGYRPDDGGWGRGRLPVINVSWNDAQTYLAWLLRKTGQTYRLLSEAEREYVTRAGTTTLFWWGSSISTRQANYDGRAYLSSVGEHRDRTLPVDSFSPNPWGLYQVHGNVSEWVEDCRHDGYAGAPPNGSVWTFGDCTVRILRGGSWDVRSDYVRSAERNGAIPGFRSSNVGFRVARTL